jgi:glutathione S-transferase
LKLAAAACQRRPGAPSPASKQESALIKGASPFIAGELSLADLYLAPAVFYVSLTPDMASLLDIEGFADWWAKVQALQCFKASDRQSLRYSVHRQSYEQTPGIIQGIT